MHPKCKEPLITHLLFADDLVIFTKPTISNITTIFEILDLFYAITGLKINFNKSHILITGLSDGLKAEIITHSGLNEMQHNARYLGLPLISARITKSDCLPLYERITDKLSIWPNTKLTQAGRLVIV